MDAEHNPALTRLGSVIRLAPGAEEEYRRLHAAVWPGVLARLGEAHITNYTIFLHGDLLFAYMEYLGDDLEGDMARVDADPETQRWLALTDPLQTRLATAGDGDRWWATMEEIFHYAGASSGDSSAA
jgi:L-rhamnose mutarotase